MREVRIFIVDDHGIFRQGLAELLLKNSSYRIVGEAGNGREALQKIEKAKPDIIFLDISMPELNGLDAISQIKRLWPSGKIIILSMHDKSTYIRSALDQGAVAYLLKDIDADELFEAINAVLDGQVYLSGKIDELIIHDHVDLVQSGKYSPPIDSLSKREREVFQLIVEGYSGKEIAGKLNISYKTVEHHRCSIMSKLSCKSIAQLIRLAAKEGIIPL